VDGEYVTPKRVESLEGSPDGGPANRILVEVRLYKFNRGVLLCKLLGVI
jgi:hypothetical protein